MITDGILQAHAIIVARAVEAQGHIEGMKADNKAAELKGVFPPFRGADFERAIEHVCWNNVCQVIMDYGGR